MQFLINTKLKNFSAVIFFNFWSLKHWIRIGIQPNMLDPDPDEMNADPQPCLQYKYENEHTDLQPRETMEPGAQ